MFDFDRLGSLPLPSLTREPQAALVCTDAPGEPCVDVSGLWYRVQTQPAYAHLPGAVQGCWLRRSAAERLMAVSAQLPQGYSLLVYDAWRPVALQKALYDDYYRKLRAQHPHMPRRRLAELCGEFVARPREDALRPAPHATGGAVDLTLCFEGRPLDMGTAFDDFSARACTAALDDGPDCPAKTNRRRLFWAMDAAGFVNYPGEWWHYAYGERLWAAVKGCQPLYSHCAGAGLW